MSKIVGTIVLFLLLSTTSQSANLLLNNGENVKLDGCILYGHNYCNKDITECIPDSSIKKVLNNIDCITYEAYQRAKEAKVLKEREVSQAELFNESQISTPTYGYDGGYSPASSVKDHYVRGYTRANGTYVAPYYRSGPYSRR